MDNFEEYYYQVNEARRHDHIASIARLADEVVMSLTLLWDTAKDHMEDITGNAPPKHVARHDDPDFWEPSPRRDSDINDAIDAVLDGNGISEEIRSFFKPRVHCMVLDKLAQKN